MAGSFCFIMSFFVKYVRYQKKKEKEIIILTKKKGKKYKESMRKGEFKDNFEIKGIEIQWKKNI